MLSHEFICVPAGAGEYHSNRPRPPRVLLEPTGRKPVPSCNVLSPYRLRSRELSERQQAKVEWIAAELDESDKTCGTGFHRGRIV
jgi:hypothetical protein